MNLRPLEPERGRGGVWTVVFKPLRPVDCPSCGFHSLLSLIPMPKTFGWAPSAEAALSMVEAKLSDPIWAAFWWGKFGAGRFYAMKLDLCVENPEPAPQTAMVGNA